MLNSMSKIGQCRAKMKRYCPNSKQSNPVKFAEAERELAKIQAQNRARSKAAHGRRVSRATRVDRARDDKVKEQKRNAPRIRNDPFFQAIVRERNLRIAAHTKRLCRFGHVAFCALGLWVLLY